MLNRVPYLDSAYPAAHTVQPTAICSTCWTPAATWTEEGPPVVSRFRLVVSAISVILIIAACNPSASPSPAGSAPAASEPAASAPPAGSASPAAGGERFDGVSVHLLTFDGPQIAEALKRRAPDFQALTGATINVAAVGFQDIYNNALLDMSTGQNSYDAFVFDPQWLGDFV